MINHRRLVGFGVAIALTFASIVLGSGVASAATGGGCSSVGSFHYGSGNVCIGASSPGVARPDAYISLNSHPACTIRIRAERLDGKAPQPLLTSNVHRREPKFQ